MPQGVQNNIKMDFLNMVWTVRYWHCNVLSVWVFSWPAETLTASERQDLFHTVSQGMTGNLFT